MDVAKLLADVREQAPLRIGKGLWIDTDKDKVDRIVDEVKWFLSELPNVLSLDFPQFILSGTTAPNDKTRISLSWFAYTNKPESYIMSHNIMFSFYGSGKIHIRINENNQPVYKIDQLISDSLEKNAIAWLNNFAKKLP